MQVVILIHGVRSRAFGEPIGLAGFNVRAGPFTAAIRPAGSLIPEKMSIRPANGKGWQGQTAAKTGLPSPDQAGKTQASPGQQHPERIELGRGRQHGGAPIVTKAATQV